MVCTYGVPNVYLKLNLVATIAPNTSQTVTFTAGKHYLEIADFTPLAADVKQEIQQFFCSQTRLEAINAHGTGTYRKITHYAVWPEQSVLEYDMLATIDNDMSGGIVELRIYEGIIVPAPFNHPSAIPLLVGVSGVIVAGAIYYFKLRKMK